LLIHQSGLPENSNMNRLEPMPPLSYAFTAALALQIALSAPAWRVVVALTLLTLLTQLKD
jgi:hypothetical protein